MPKWLKEIRRKKEDNNKNLLMMFWKKDLEIQSEDKDKDKDKDKIEVWTYEDPMNNFTRLENLVNRHIRTLRIYLAISSMFLLIFGGTLYMVNNNVNDSIASNKAIKEMLKDVKPSEQVNSAVTVTQAPTQPFLNVDFTTLKQRNSEVVAWLKIGSVDINMPIVQHSDNEFYLNHDIDKKDNSTGWVFMDNSNDPVNLGFNTVIYGHNMASGAMLGTLKKLINSDKLYTTNDGVIQLTIPSRQMVLQIVSVYVTTYEDWSYVQKTFTSSQKETFISNLKKKNNVKAFSTNDLSTLDRFVTLSTCYGNAGTTKRLVVVAKVVAENN